MIYMKIETETRGTTMKVLLITKHNVVIVLTIVFSCIGMIYNYKMSMNVFGELHAPDIQ